VWLVPGFSAFFIFFALIWLASIAGFVIGIAALISVSKLPSEAFGPWWDNIKQTWLIGIAVGFVVPFGTLITGILWFNSGRTTLRTVGVAGRPFWAGPPKPPPLQPPPGWGGYAAGPYNYPAPPPGPPPGPVAPSAPPR
jgi:hypothetical protein